MRELLLGCGSQRIKAVTIEGMSPEFQNVTTLDIEPTSGADVIHDLNVVPWPFADNEFDEIHAYEVLEHFGQQGDVKAFFAHFHEIWRILKPGGLLCGSVPMWDSPWAWSDPGHTRVITIHTLGFLDRDSYEQVGSTPMADYRSLWHGDLKPVAYKEGEHRLGFVMRAAK